MMSGFNATNNIFFQQMDCNDDIFAKCYPHLAFTSGGIGAPCSSFQGILPQILDETVSRPLPRIYTNPQTSADPEFVSPNYGYTLTVEEKNMYLPEGMRSLVTTPCDFQPGSPATELTRQFEEDLEVELINESIQNVEQVQEASTTADDSTQFLSSPFNQSGSSFTSRSSSFLPSYAKKLQPQQIQTESCSESESDWVNRPGTSFAFEENSSKFRPLLTPNSELKRSHGSTDSPILTVERPRVTRLSLDTNNWFPQITDLDVQEPRSARLSSLERRAHRSLTSDDLYSESRSSVRGFAPPPVELPEPPKYLLEKRMEELQNLPCTSDSWENADEGELVQQMENLLVDAKKKADIKNTKKAAMMETPNKELTNVTEIFAIPDDKNKDDVIASIDTFDLGDFSVHWYEKKAVFVVFKDSFDVEKLFRHSRHEWLRFRKLQDSPQNVKQFAIENMDKLVYVESRNRPRPKTNVSVARRMIEHALNKKSDVSKEKRDAERAELRSARQAKKNAPKWD